MSDYYDWPRSRPRKAGPVIINFVSEIFDLLQLKQLREQMASGKVTARDIFMDAFIIPLGYGIVSFWLLKFIQLTLSRAFLPNNILAVIFLALSAFIYRDNIFNRRLDIANFMLTPLKQAIISSYFIVHSGTPNMKVEPFILPLVKYVGRNKLAYLDAYLIVLPSVYIVLLLQIVVVELTGLKKSSAFRKEMP